MSAATLRANRTAATNPRRRYRSWLRLVMLENRITPTVILPDLASIPHPLDFTPGYGQASYPAGFDQFAPPIDHNAPALGPTISEWTRTGQPDQTLAITGD